MAVLTVCSHKGGTGKTTTAWHLAAGLGEQGRSVLAVDLDPQGFLTRAVGPEEADPLASPARATAAALLRDGQSLTAFRPRDVGPFDLIPAGPALTQQQAELQVAEAFGRLRAAFRPVHPYELIIIDTGPGLGALTLNALTASDRALIPVVPDYADVAGARQTRATCQWVRKNQNDQLGLSWLLLTKVDRRSKTHRRYRQTLREELPPVLNTEIRTSAALARAPMNGQPIFQTDPTARGAVDYRALTGEIAERLGGTDPEG